MADKVESQELQAEGIYYAIMQTLKEVGTLGLLQAAGDAKAFTSWDKAASRTREVFRKIATNLTAQAPKA